VTLGDLDYNAISPGTQLWELLVDLKQLYILGKIHEAKCIILEKNTNIKCIKAPYTKTIFTGS
jgi:hypothetical protein